MEFPLKPAVDRSYGYMAAAFGQDYWVLPQLSSHYLLKYHVDASATEALERLLHHIVDKKGVLKPEKHDEL